MADENRNTRRNHRLDAESYDKATLQLGRARAIAALLYNEVSDGGDELDHITLEAAIAQLQENLAATEDLLEQASLRARELCRPAA